MEIVEENIEIKAELLSHFIIVEMSKQREKKVFYTQINPSSLVHKHCI